MLSDEEGAIWSYIFQHRDREDLQELESQISALLDESETLGESYLKRSKTPTDSTYRECKSLISAMGIPILETPFPFEAEGLASSLAIHGDVDLVGSEDSVCCPFSLLSHD